MSASVINSVAQVVHAAVRRGERAQAIFQLVEALVAEHLDLSLVQEGRRGMQARMRELIDDDCVPVADEHG